MGEGEFTPSIRIAQLWRYPRDFHQTVARVRCLHGRRAPGAGVVNSFDA